MDTRKQAFVEAVVGEDGARALVKAASASVELEWAIVPRTLLAWLEAVGPFGYDGQLPGVSSTRLTLRKSGDGFSGRVNVADEVYQFDDATVYHVAGAVAVALGAEGMPAPELGHPRLGRLGKSIDLLVRARALRKIAASAPKAPSENIQRPGLPAAQRPPEAPEEPIPAQEERQVATGQGAGTQTRAGRPAKPARAPKRSLRVTKAEAARRCPACAEPMLAAGELCFCFKDLQKSTRAVAAGDALVLEFGPSWDADAVLTWIENLKGDHNAR